MRKILTVLILMVVGFAGSAAFAVDLVHTTYKSPDFGDVFVEYDMDNKGLAYDETGLLKCQVNLARFYSVDCYVDVSEISYCEPRETDSNLDRFIYKTTKEYGWIIATNENIKLCYFNVAGNEIAVFTICLLPKK